MAHVAAAVILLVLSGGCMSQRSADATAQSLFDDVRREAAFVSGPTYSAAIELRRVAKVTPSVSLAGIGPAAYEADYSILLRSLEVTSFTQSVSTFRRFGPGSEQLIGGLHDWTLLKEIARWDAPRRLALMRHFVALGNPTMSAVTSLEDSSGGSWETGDTPMRRRLLEIGARSGYAASDLYWASHESQDRGDLIAYDAARKRWQTLASRAPEESGELVEAK
jgi:hypothetical protein